MRDPITAPLHFVKSTTSLASRLSLRTLPLHTHEILGSFALYTAIGLSFSPRISQTFCPQTYQPLSERSKTNWNTRVVSLCQSCLINAVALWVIFKDKERRAFGAKERVWGYTGAGGMVQGLSAGYFLWDVITSALHYEVHGLGSLVHAVCALSVSMLGFVSSVSVEERVPSTDVFCRDRSVISTASISSCMSYPRHSCSSIGSWINSAGPAPRPSGSMA